MLRAGLLTFTALASIAVYFVSERPAEPQSAQPQPERTNATAAAEPSAPLPPPVVVVLPERRGRVDPVQPSSDVSLTRQIQQELQRVGCYDRELNGIWTTSSRLATQNFMMRVNAKLPIDTPDATLLALLQSHAGIVCGASCPLGETIDGVGRCIPSALAVGRHARAANHPAPARIEITGSIPSPRPVAPSNSAASLAATTGQSQLAHAMRSPDQPSYDGSAGAVSRRSTRSAQAAPAKYWQSLMRSVDRALGF